MLHARAQDYVTHITDDGYSYAYIQFYWRRAQTSIERVLRVYPQTETGRKLATGELKLGPYALDYFKDRVLPRLEEKRVAAYDAVNCAIFLYNVDEVRWDAPRLAAQDAILEVLARQKRWSEALDFPVRDEEKTRKLATIFRVAARFDQKDLIESLLKRATDDQRAVLIPIQAEAMALFGRDRADIAELLDENPTTDVKLGALAGMVEREVQIRRAAALRLAIKDGIQTVHYSLNNLATRDDVEAVARTFFPQPTPASQALLARYHAALGAKPAPGSALANHIAYVEYLGAFEKFDELATYPASLRLSTADRHALALAQIEAYAKAGRVNDATAARVALSEKATPGLADQATLAEFRGRMLAAEAPLTVRDTTFASLPITDPNVLAVAAMEWSLTPNRSIRGPSPWDSVVRKYLPGFENLPLPKSKEVQDAAGNIKPY